MDVPLSRFLARFSFEDEHLDEPIVEEHEALVSPIEDPMEALIAAALADAASRHAAEITSLRAEHAAASDKLLAETRQIWCDTEGTKFAERLDGLLSDLRLLLADKIGDALTPIAAHAVVERTRDALLESVATILSDPDHPAIAIHAPADLLDAVRAAHPEVTGIRYITHDDIDATVVADSLRIETRLEAALSTLVEAGH